MEKVSDMRRATVLLVASAMLVPGLVVALDSPDEALAAAEPDADARLATTCNHLPLLVDECGDTMTGNLVFSGSSGIRFSAGTLTGSGDLRFGGNPVCRGGVPVAGCGDLEGVSAGSGLTGGGTSGTPSLAVANGGITGAHINTGTTVKAASFQYNAPVTRAYMLTFADFIPADPTLDYRFGIDHLVGRQAGQGLDLVAAVHLPDGASITSLRLDFEDNDAAPIRASLWTGPGLACCKNAEVVSSGASPGVRSIVDTTIGGNPVDNQGETNTVRVFWVVPATTTAIKLYGVVLTYTVPSPAP